MLFKTTLTFSTKMHFPNKTPQDQISGRLSKADALSE